MLKEYHHSRIGCLPLEAAEADFGISWQSPNLGSEHSLLDHKDSVSVKIEEFGSANEMELKE